MRRFSLVASLLLLAACSGSVTGLKVENGVVPRTCCRADQGGPIDFEYLGSGGWMIRRGEDAVLTAPFFTNPRVIRAVLLPIRPAQRLIAQQMQSLAGRERLDVVVAGHAHYDHLLDLPDVLSHIPSAARVVGGTTIAAMLPDRVEGIVPGQWMRRRNVRVLAIPSTHAPHVLGLKFNQGKYDEPPKRLRYGRDWVEGEKTYAFLIDLMDGDRVAFRIYYDDAAHDPPDGFPGRALLDEHGIDVAILCVASWQQVKQYPKALLEHLQPRHVLLGHWEDFFLPYLKPERTVRLTNVRGFTTALPEGTEWTMLKRRATVRFTPD